MSKVQKAPQEFPRLEIPDSQSPEYVDFVSKHYKQIIQQNKREGKLWFHGLPVLPDGIDYLN